MGRNMLRSLLGLFLALAASFAAHAFFPAPTPYSYYMAGASFSSFDAMLADHMPPRGLSAPICAEWSGNTRTCTFMTSSGTRSGNQTAYRVAGPATCPPNSTAGGSNCTCNAGYTEVGSTCVAPSVCDVGQGRTFNRTQGWARTPNADADDLVVDYGPGDLINANDGVCVGPIQSVDRCYRSQVPTAQGLYRVSCDFTMVMTGDAPSGSVVPETDPTTANATCPGFVGEVNGKTVCVGTASAPLPTPVAAPNAPTAAGNPSAGVKPSSGEGSGSDGPSRTPSTGSGGNAGGPSGAAVGSGGTGVRDSDGTEPVGAVCGASPLPPCAVKVDETGTPNGATFGTSPELDTALNNREAGLATARDKAGDAGWGIVPAWTADQACEPWEIWTLPDDLGGDVVTVNLCPLMPLAEGILNFIWAMLGIFATTSMVAAAMTGKGT